MTGGILAAAGGMKAQMEALDILANNLANVNTAGFKEQKAFINVLSEEMKSKAGGDAQTGPDAVPQSSTALNPLDGVMQVTSRDLDVALSGDGFLAVNTPRGLRYTRNGSLSINSRTELSTSDGFPVMGEGGPILLGAGKISITPEGDISLDGTNVGKLKIVAFDNPAKLQLEGRSLLAVPSAGVKEKPASSMISQGFLEMSNVNAVGSIVEMVSIMRRYESLQKSISVLSNNLDAKAVEKLGR
jgi:flagellar basal-body rod protein FlgF